MAFTILYDTAAAGLARKIILPGQLDPLLAVVIHIRKAEHECGQFAGRVVTPILAFKKYTWNVELDHLGRHLRRQMTLQIYKISPGSTLGSTKALAKFPGIKPDQGRQFFQLLRSRVHILRARPD